jgi:UDP-N-acetylglucosamine--N-acetylmuramyl-(pentapeptide) pyrophosphoryl-undecaprenol N-acetylglucosamine transferase
MLQREARIILSGGGTGGHIYPAIAIANAIREIQPSADILFVGANGRMEMEKVPEAGYPIRGLDISGLQRKFSWSLFSFPFKVIASVMDALKIIREFKPDAVAGMGGYASGPLLYAATMRNVPCLIQEQNSYPGITNKLLAKRVSRICAGYDGMEKYFPAEKITVTGTPVRGDIAHPETKRAEALSFFQLDERKKTVFVTGGSLGARTINEGIAENLTALIDARIQILWQTGKNYHDQVIERFGHFESAGVKTFPFMKRMDLAYAAADIVVSRAGASSIAELCLAGKPAILIPSPNVAEDHQTKNAMALVSKNAALMLKDIEVRTGLASQCIGLLQDDDKMQTLAKNIRMMAYPDAARIIACEILNLVKKS